MNERLCTSWPGRDRPGDEMNATKVPDGAGATGDDATGSGSDERAPAAVDSYQLMAEAADDVIWTMTLDGRVTSVSDSSSRVWGRSVDEVTCRSIDSVHTPDSAAVMRDHLDQLRAAIDGGLGPVGFQCEAEHAHPDGTVRYAEVRVVAHRDADGQVVELIGAARDITHRRLHELQLRLRVEELEATNRSLRAANEELRLLAATDPLTGAWNRRYFVRIAEREIRLARRRGQPLSMLMLDIDHFRSVKDHHGFEIGDLVLVALTQRLRSRLRSTDVLTRWGGEEFVVLLPDCTVDDATNVARTLRQRIADEPFPPIGEVTVSIGVSELGEGDDLEAWLRRTDDVLYAAKMRGRNRVNADRRPEP